MIKLTLAQIELIKEFTSRRSNAENQRTKLSAFPAASVGVQFTAIGGVQFAEKARADTEIGMALKDALLTHYKNEIDYCTRALSDLGVEIEDAA